VFLAVSEIPSMFPRVIPRKPGRVGIPESLRNLDSRLRGNDG
jgi:hypothetical protein